MAKQDRAGNWESGLLAAALALAGTLFFFNKVCSLVRAGMLSVHMLASSAPVLLLIVGIGLMLADHGAFRESGSLAEQECRERKSA